MDKSLYRAILYIRRKPFKSSILLSIMTVITLLMIVGISIKDSSLQQAAALRESLGSSFGIIIDKTKSDNFQSNGKDGLRYTGEPLNKALVDQITKQEQIADYNINVNGQAFLKANKQEYLKLIETNDKYKDDEILKHTIAFETNSYAEKSTLFQKEKLSLIEGDFIEKGDKNVAMISTELAQINSLSIGDTIYLSDDTNKQIALKIKGIFKVEEMQMGAASAPPASSYYNRIFTDVDSMYPFFDGYSRIDFMVKDPAQMDSLLETLQRDNTINWDSFTIDKNDTEYQKAVKPLQDMNSLVDIFLGITLLSSACILSMVLSLWMKSRIYEIGVFISAGMHKQSVLYQHLIEVILLSWVSFILSVPFSILLCNSIVPMMLAQSLAVSVSSKACYVSILMISIVIIVSVLVSNLIVLRLKPKKILSKMS